MIGNGDTDFFVFVQNNFVDRFIVFINVLRVSQCIFESLNKGGDC